MLIHGPIETARLILRPESTDISAAIHAMNTDPEVMRFIGNGKAWTSPLDEFLQQHRAALARNADQKYGGVSVHLKACGEFIGLCWLTPNGYLGDKLELGYRYIRSAWGFGYATEAALAVVDIGWSAFACPRSAHLCTPRTPAASTCWKSLDSSM